MNEQSNNRFILLSIFSKEDNCGGLAVYDLESSASKYVQLLDFSTLPGRTCHVRGVHWVGEHLYAVSPFALFIFGPNRNLDGAGLLLEKRVLLREWILGPGQQGCLHSVLASPRRGNIHVSFNAQCAIDTLDLAGNLIRRRYLWEIAPDMFPLPRLVPTKKQFRFGLVRHILGDENECPLLTVSHLNGFNQGALMSADSGEVFLETPYNPHSSFVHQDKIFLSDIDAGQVHAYSWPVIKNLEYSTSVKSFEPVADVTRWPGSIQNVRGMVVLGDRLVCGVCNIGKANPTQIPPRLVEFDVETGEQLAEHFLPNFVGLRNAQVYAINQVPPWLGEKIRHWDEPRYYRQAQRFEPELHKKSIFKQDVALISPGIEIPKGPAGTCQGSNSLEQPKELILSQDATPIPLNIKTPQGPAEICLENDLVEQREPAQVSEEIHSGLVYSQCEHSSKVLDASVFSGSFVQAPAVKNPSRGEHQQRTPCILLDNVGVCFVRRATSIFGWNRQLKKKRTYWALRDVSFVLHEGETVGVIGRNGSGKSTLSLVCAGVYKPDTGSVTIHGRVQLLALGVGFKNELTGRDNVYISASLLGLNRRRTHELFPEIEAFAELGEFMDEPVRTYSSGMKSKLGFAVATAVEPEILILDEAMSVGDKAFKDKAVARMREMQKKAKSVLIVSHNPGEIKKLCSRVLWMERGRLMMDGDANTVVHAYENFCKNPEKWLLRNPEYILETV